MTCLGIALGSGGARGLAHIGVLNELADMGIQPERVAGSSMGSIVGACYCADQLGELESVAGEIDLKRFLLRFLDLGFARSGLLEGKRIQEFLEEVVPEARIESLRIPFSCVATDLETGEERVFAEGPLHPALRASIAIPGVFTPARVDGRYLVDGGLVNPVPVDVVRNLGADKVIGVDVNDGCLQARTRSRTTPSEPSSGTLSRWLQHLRDKLEEKDPDRLRAVKEWLEPNPMPTVFDVMGNTIHIIEKRIGEMRLRQDSPDLLLQPEVGDVKMFDFHRAEDLIEAGRQCVWSQADDIRRLVGQSA